VLFERRPGCGIGGLVEVFAQLAKKVLTRNQGSGPLSA
jgi:hypothetical protein